MRRLLLLLLAAPLLLACGDDPTPADADAAAGASASEPGEGDGHDVGYQRIVGDLMTVDYLTALGYDTSRIVGVFDRDFFPPDHYLHEQLEGPVDIGSTYDPNLEQIAALRPDVILLPTDQVQEEFLDELEAIAPVQQVETSSTDDPRVRFGGKASFQDWRSTIRAYGEALGLEAQAEAFIQETEATIADLHTEHDALIQAITATQAKSTPDYLAINALSAAREAGALGSILMSELGFRSPPQQEALTPDEYGSIDLSAENLSLLDGDLLFLEVRDGGTKHEDSPLWPSLGVVRSGGVIVVGNHWQYGGAMAARRVLADIEGALDALAERRG